MSFNNHLYEQVDEIPMGSPLGSSVANLFMCALKQNFLSYCPSAYKPIFYRRFVDDAFCISEIVLKLIFFLIICITNILISNSHMNLRKIIRYNFWIFWLHLDDSFSTNLYRKKTFTGLYIHFNNLSAFQYKINLISTLIYHAFHICSTYIAFHRQMFSTAKSFSATAYCSYCQKVSRQAISS